MATDAPTAHHRVPLGCPSALGPRYGYRPALQRTELHCVLPTRIVRARPPIVGTSWCGDGQHVWLEDGPSPDGWRSWPQCLRCLPGYHLHCVMAAVGAGEPGRSRSVEDIRGLVPATIGTDQIDRLVATLVRTGFLRRASRARRVGEPAGRYTLGYLAVAGYGWHTPQRPMSDIRRSQREPCRTPNRSTATGRSR
jgi:hypothetical protein